MFKTALRCISTLALAMMAQPLLAQEGDVFDFIPGGGRTILSGVMTAGNLRQALELLQKGKQGPAEWLGQFDSLGGNFPALKALTEKQRQTLASYLATNIPISSAQLPAGGGIEAVAKALPPDGRDLILSHCQSCHIITVVVTQSRTREAWLGTMNKPSHIEIETTPQQREEIATYLVLNAGISIDQIPEELRAGGATY